MCAAISAGNVGTHSISVNGAQVTLDLYREGNGGSWAIYCGLLNKDDEVTLYAKNGGGSGALNALYLCGF